MNKWWYGAVFMFGLGGQVMAADWVPVKQEGHTVREIDQGSIVRNGAQVTFTARHTFNDVKEYLVGRRGAKYLHMFNRGDCEKRTLAQLGTEAYDEKMIQIARQKLQMPQDAPVTAGSIDDGMLALVCGPAKPATP